MEKEQIPMVVADRILGENCQVRVALAIHPVTNELAPCIPYKDYAMVFAYDAEVIRKMIQRTSWLKRYSTAAIMAAVDGKFRPNLCIFEEAVIGITMKLQPQRCKDPFVSAHIDKRQEELTIMLKDVLKGNAPQNDVCQKSEAHRYKIARSKISMLNQISQMPSGQCKEQAIKVFESVTGEAFERPRQMPLFDDGEGNGFRGN